MSDLFVDTSYPLQPIKSLVSISYGKGLAAKIRDEKGKVPVYGSNGIIGYHSESITKAPIIIIGRKGSVGAVNFSDTNCWPIDTSFYIDEYPDDLEPKWLYYCLTSLEFGIHAQGPKPGIKRDLLYQTEIPVPSLNEQRRIVARIEELTRRAEEARRLRQKAVEQTKTIFWSELSFLFGNFTSSKGWTIKPFPKMVTRIQTKRGKLKTKEYRKSGCLPIVDQGQDIVVAYTDKKDCRFQGPYPVIVFGDHTKNVKLLDFEFAVGADGVVLLRPLDENELDICFLYYWLKYVPLHNL
ncbi:MAG: restriction endonuclease subunit S, partial [Proteobacteria bacterium]|nr:restriction endonuclease subunit S [Pseudomonadota bacterium]